MPAWPDMSTEMVHADIAIICRAAVGSSDPGVVSRSIWPGNDPVGGTRKLARQGSWKPAHERLNWRRKTRRRRRRMPVQLEGDSACRGAPRWADRIRDIRPVRVEECRPTRDEAMSGHPT